MKSPNILSILVMLGSALGMSTATYAAERDTGRGTGPGRTTL